MRFVKIDPNLVLKKNVIVTAPTGSGKTHASLKVVKELVPTHFKRAFFLVPTKALSHEVYKKAKEEFNIDVIRDDSDARLEKNLKIEEWFEHELVVTTYERFDSVALMSPSVFNDSLVIIDEIHNMIFPGRVLTLIDILALLKMAQDKKVNTRAILLSATIPQLDELKEYLNAEVIVHNVKRDIKVEIVREDAYVRGSFMYYMTKADILVKLFEEGKITKDDLPILVYVPSRKWSETVARYLKSTLKFEDVEVGFHHAGLSHSIRKKWEEKLREKGSKVIVVATDTLSQGVNTAVKTVVVMGITLFRPHSVEYVSPAIIRQVIGRAGRPQYGEKGRAIIIVINEQEEAIVKKALEGDYGKIVDIDDYYALVLRLLFTKRPIDVYAKYAFKIDKEKFLEAFEVLKEEGFIDNDALTPLGVLGAKEYLNRRWLALLKHALNLASEGTLLDVARASTFLAFLGERMHVASFPMCNSLLTEARALMPPAEFIANLRVNTIMYGGNLDDIEEAFSDILPLMGCDTFPLDSFLETLRKASQVLNSATTLGLLEEALKSKTKFLMNLFKGARKLLKLGMSNEKVVTFIVKSLVELNDAWRDDYARVNVVDVYVVWSSKGEGSVQPSYEELSRLSKRRKHGKEKKVKK